jgi:HEAT repeat protein
VFVLAVAGLAAAWLELRPRARMAAQRSRLMTELAAPDAQRRVRAAREVAQSGDPQLFARLQAGVMGDETDAGVRDAMVNSLGRIGTAAFLAGPRFAAQLDPDGNVRAQGWLALARISPQRFEELRSEATSDDDWQRLGIADALLELGDTSGVADLLRLAREGDAGQKRFARQSIRKRLRPFLDAVGRWPVAADRDAELSDDSAAEIEKRVATLEPAALMNDTRPHLVQTELFRRDVRRLTNARERIVRVLFPK